MPFKTRKKKVSAVGRHVINFSENTVISYSSGDRKVVQNKTTSSVEDVKYSRSIEADYGFVKSELAKITLLAAMIIGLQVALKLSHLPLLG